MDVMFWLTAIGVAIILVLIVLAAISIDTQRQRMMVRRIAAERRLLAEQRRRARGEGVGARSIRFERVGASSDSDWDED